MLSGALSPPVLAQMSSEELKNPQEKAEAKALEEAAYYNAQKAQVEEAGETGFKVQIT